MMWPEIALTFVFAAAILAIGGGLHIGWQDYRRRTVSAAHSLVFCGGLSLLGLAASSILVAIWT
jgi:hypothetical protein